MGYYDDGVAAQEANEWAAELRAQKIPDEPVWHSEVKLPNGRRLLTVKVFREVGNGGSCYASTEEQTDPGDYTYTEHDTLVGALQHASFLEDQAIDALHAKFGGKK